MKERKNYKMKVNYKKIILFIVLFIVFFVCHYYLNPFSNDELWNYGFAYNIKNGMMPYRDFNMVITPLYSYLLASLILIFKNSFSIMIALNSIIVSIIECILIDKNGKKGLLFFPLLLYMSYNCYNILSLALFMIFLNIVESKKKNEYLTGFIVSLMLLTKQTIGGLIFIASFILSKNKKEYIIGFSPLCIIFLTYLFFTNSLYNFFDYCLFGMFDFTSGNFSSGIHYPALILYIILFIIMFRSLIKSKINNYKILYIILFQIMAFPLLDFQHISISILPVLSYFFENKSTGKIAKEIELIAITFFLVTGFIANISIPDVKKYYNKESFLNQMYIAFDMDKFVYNLKKEIEINYANYKVYHLYRDAYLYKLEVNERINKFDLNNKGNMGYNGENKWIKEIDNDCKNTKCLIILDHYKNINSQISMKLNNHIINKYTFKKTIESYDLYINENDNKTDET